MFVVTLKRVDDITLKPATVAENAPAGTVVGSLSVPNAGGNLTYSTTTGDGHRHNYLFDVVDGKLVTARVLDFEELGGSLTVRIAATDGGGTVQYENAVTVILTDVPDVVVKPNRIDENVDVGTVVGDISVVGDDAAADYKFRFAHGSGDAHNDAFAIVRGQLVTATEMDFETMGATLSVRIRAVDPATGEAVYVNAINIGLNDLDDEDPDNGAAEQEIIDALRPTCEPYGDEFVLLRFPQLDPASSWHYSFGADRDGGVRQHRGADIFGEKHLPLLPSAEGTVVRYGTGAAGRPLRRCRTRGRLGVDLHPPQQRQLRNGRRSGTADRRTRPRYRPRRGSRGRPGARLGRRQRKCRGHLTPHPLRTVGGRPPCGPARLPRPGMEVAPASPGARRHHPIAEPSARLCRRPRPMRVELEAPQYHCR